jgi:hypothetical protein
MLFNEKISQSFLNDGKRILIFFITILFYNYTFSQSDSSLRLKKNDSLELTTHYNKNKIKKLACINAGIYGGSMLGLYNAWYKNYPQTSFHTFNDIAEWQQMDKIGHAYSAYTMGNYSIALWKQAGMDRKKSIWIGGLTGALYQTVIETLDAYSAAWGWSWGDISANMIGSGMLIAQELAWDEQKIQFKVSFHEKNYSDETLKKRNIDLFGKTAPERFLKDYNGQTYWLSIKASSIIPNNHLPRWLNIAIGTGAEGMFGARQNIAYDKNGSVVFNRPDIKKYRQWYLAPDIDLTKIKTKNKYVKSTLFILNALKFPMPAIEYGNSKFRFHYVYF